MAKGDSPRARGQVPVSRRELNQRHKQAVATIKARRQPMRPISHVEFAILATVLVAVIVIVGVPIQNYAQQRSDIARVKASISAKQRQKDELSAQLQQLQNDDYVREQARARFGVIEPGETAFRILDPALGDNPQATKRGELGQPTGPWYDVLWSSIAVPADDATEVVIGIGQPAAPETPEATSRLPIEGQPLPAAPGQEPADAGEMTGDEEAAIGQPAEAGVEGPAGVDGALPPGDAPAPAGN
ncbi:septum formation initiator family protein [Corynebacterium sp. 13CS0277]|uniref:FtsB family cell division protein n=1 Tax=Corynebacterium sp. 13CS0277 TaxID=2071994 RepID=UPI000D02CAB7|nr:septum formation initiator family protein [Corynebacterium sp. 13CS0277]